MPRSARSSQSPHGAPARKYNLRSSASPPPPVQPAPHKSPPKARSPETKTGRKPLPEPAPEPKPTLSPEPVPPPEPAHFTPPTERTAPPTITIMEEEEDDMYGTSEAAAGPHSTANAQATGATAGTNGAQAVKEEAEAEDEDEDESSEEEDSDDDIEIITQRKPGEEPAPPAHSHRQPTSSAVKIEAPRSVTPAVPQLGTPATAGAATTPLGRVASPAAGRPGSSYPEVKTSTLDLEGNPMLGATGKPILNTDMDADFVADTAPWRRPGSDMTDYYNYGFDEGTWAAYCIKQRQLRGEIAEDRKRMEQLAGMMGGSMPFNMMPGMDATAGAGMAMPSMDQMQQMMNMMGGMPGMPGMDGGMGQPQNPGYQNQGGYGGGRNQGGRGKRW